MASSDIPRKFTPEHCAAISAATKGRKFSAEHKAKLSASHAGLFHGKPAQSAEERAQSRRDASARFNQTPKGKANRKTREAKRKIERQENGFWRTPDQKHRARVKNAAKYGYAPPPHESECRPKPSDGRCECCLKLTKRFHLDHDHETGEFRGWTCSGCNTGHGLPDDIDRLQNRIEYLKRRLPWL